MNVLVLGSTGLVGNEILHALDKLPKISRICTVSRRAPNLDSPKLDPIINPDTSQWAVEIAKNSAKTFFSAFGTTRAVAGSAQAFIDIDYGYNYEAAKLACKAGVDTFVLVSAFAANPNSMFLYQRTKGRLEQDITALRFKNLIILRPGVLLGVRNGSHTGFGDGIATSLCRYVHGTFLEFLGYPCYAKDVATVAVAAATDLESLSNAENNVRIISALELNKWAKNLSCSP